MNQNNISLKKVIKGLEYHSEGNCFKSDDDETGCPYWKDSFCSQHLCSDVLALLKAQESRVMTLEEYKAWADIPFCERDPIFHEMRLRRGPVTGWTNTAECSVENYGKTERCWTSRPTDEQMEATAWIKN